MRLVSLGGVLRLVVDAAQAQQTDTERPAHGEERGGDPQIHFLLVRGEEGAADGTRGKRGREDWHWGRLRQYAGHTDRHCQTREAMRPRESPIAPLLVEEISRPVYAALDGHAVR